MKKTRTLQRVAPVLQPLTLAERGAMPVTLARILSPVVRDLGTLEVIRPTPADPVLLADGKAIALWIEL